MWPSSNPRCYFSMATFGLHYSLKCHIVRRMPLKTHWLCCCLLLRVLRLCGDPPLRILIGCAR